MEFLKKLFSKKALILNIKIFSGIATVYLLTAFALIYWPKPEPFSGSLMTEDVWTTVGASESSETSHETAAKDFEVQTRDGISLKASRYGHSDSSVIIYMHGVASDRSSIERSARLLHDVTDAEVIIYDHRGHGDSGGNRHDVEYIGQYEDDLRDMIMALKKQAPNRKIIIAGHSMGGGIAMRYALKEDFPPPDAYLLIAPNFGEGPTQRKGEEVDETFPEGMPVFFEFDVKRMIGQIMLSSVGLSFMDHLPIMYFNHWPDMLAYSYRAVLSAQPIRPNTADKALQAVKVPLLVVVGRNDEQFIAENFSSFVSANSDGKTEVIDDANHSSILTSAGGFAAIRDWYKGLPLLDNSPSPSNSEAK